MAGASWVFMLLLCKQVICQITGPSQLTYFIGDNAHFRWNNTNNNSIISYATWGIKKGDIADPKFVSVDILSSKVHFNLDLERDLLSRVSFQGDLEKGRAWFTLKNVTVNDTNEYIASISDDEKMPLPYTVVLTVKEREENDEQNELKDITTKEPDTNHVVTTLFPQLVTTSTKDPAEPANVIILIAVFLAMLLVVLIFAIIICKKKSKKQDRRGTSWSEKKLIENPIFDANAPTQVV